MNGIPIEPRIPASIANYGKTRLFQRANYFGPLILWAVFIFIMSSRIGGPENSLGALESVLKWIFPDWSARLTPDQAHLLNLLMRKIGHLSEYFIFALLASRALCSGQPRIGSVWALKALALSVGYACTDELHQHFVPGRTGAIADVLLDSIGASAALLVVLIIDRRQRFASGNGNSKDPLEVSA